MQIISPSSIAFLRNYSKRCSNETGKKSRTLHRIQEEIPIGDKEYSSKKLELHCVDIGGTMASSWKAIQ